MIDEKLCKAVRAAVPKNVEIDVFLRSQGGVNGNIHRMKIEAWLYHSPLPPFDAPALLEVIKGDDWQGDEAGTRAWTRGKFDGVDCELLMKACDRSA